MRSPAMPGAVRRLSADVLKRKFWLLPVLGLVLGAVVGYSIPALDGVLSGDVGLFSATDVDAARSLLQTIATVTISVAGISISIVAVAFTLASQQLSPRVLRTFRGDRLSQATLGLFLGVFAYAIVVLATLGPDRQDLNLSLTVGVLAAGLSFVLFAAFIHNALVSLDPSTLIRRIAADAHELIDHPYPAGVGEEPRDPSASTAEADRRVAAGRRAEVRSPVAGYLTGVDGAKLVEAARRMDGVVVQRMLIGDFVVTGALLAEVHAAEAPETLAEEVARCFRLGEQRTLDQDVAFPLRQLADVALRGLSPSLNDPTTAENAMGSLADSVIRFVGQRTSHRVRVDSEGAPRFVAAAADLDDLIRLGFEQVRVKAATYPTVSAQIARLLGEIERAARSAGREPSEAARQRELVTESVEQGGPVRHDVEVVAAARDRLGEA